MDTAGFRCVDCGQTVEASPAAGRCPDCEGALLATYDYEALADEPTATALDGLLGLPPDDRLDLGQGGTPELDAPALAGTLGVSAVTVKAENQNPTGALVDRELALAVAAADAAGASDVALPSMGHGGQAAAAAAARAGLDAHAYVPSRTPFVNKAMINVHGGDMTVVEGRYRDAAAAVRDGLAEAGWTSVAPFETPFRQEGVKPLAYELAATRDWGAPDWVVVPTGQVTALVGIDRGFRDLAELGLVAERPRLVAAQARGCAPLAEAVDAGADRPVAVDRPDTVVGPLEIPEPAGGRLALRAIRESGGTALASDDAAILEAAVGLAERGLPASVTGGAALAAAQALRDRGELDEGDDVVLINPVAGNKEADLLRSHLMSKGR